MDLAGLKSVNRFQSAFIAYVTYYVILMLNSKSQNQSYKFKIY